MTNITLDDLKKVEDYFKDITKLDETATSVYINEHEHLVIIGKYKDISYKLFYTYMLSQLHYYCMSVGYRYHAIEIENREDFYPSIKKAISILKEDVDNNEWYYYRWPKEG